ncbi:hypothetical protein [Bradyrhizobium macuxiense]|nr:hypothetical protein [Bradyrhizobium macuxiense]
MIGVVGPDDTVAMIERVAEEIGLNSILVVAKYKSPRETAELVRALQPVCPVILFSGRLPYRLAISAGFAPDNLDYIPHEGTDLFRALALVALGKGYTGQFPKFSFDCMAERDVSEAYDELRLSDDYHVIPLEIDSDSSEINLDRIISTHRSLLEQGKIEHCFTCIRSVFETLSASRLPVFRINHARISVRQALLRAQLRHELVQAEASQVAICVLSQRSASNTRGKHSTKRLSKAAGLCSDLLGGRIVKIDLNEALWITTRGAIDRHLKALPLSSVSVRDPAFILGIGIGPNADQAEAFARQAQQRTSSPATRYFQIQQTAFIVEKMDPNEAREERQSDLKAARNLQVSPAVIRRLGVVFQELDPNGFTSAELAKSYSIQPRSARRLLTLLKDRGFVEECGLGARHRAGRPELIYRIFLDRMLFPIR